MVSCSKHDVDLATLSWHPGSAPEFQAQGATFKTKCQPYQASPAFDDPKKRARGFFRHILRLTQCPCSSVVPTFLNSIPTTYPQSISTFFYQHDNESYLQSIVVHSCPSRCLSVLNALPYGPYNHFKPTHHTTLSSNDHIRA